MSQWHSKTTKEVLDQLKVTAESGLTDSEVKKRLEQYGPNELKSAEKESLFRFFGEKPGRESGISYSSMAV